MSVSRKWGLIGGRKKENEERTKAPTEKSKEEGGPENQQEHKRKGWTRLILM
jgi:hypothetical protein